MEAQGPFPLSCKYLSCGTGEPSQKAKDTSIQGAESLKICPHQQCAGTGHFQQQQRNQPSHSWQNMTEILDGASLPSSLVLLLSMKERAWAFRNKSFCFSASDFMAQERRCLKGLSNIFMFPFNSIFLNMAKQVIVHVSVIRIGSYKALQHLNSWMKSWLHLFIEAFSIYFNRVRTAQLLFAWNHRETLSAQLAAGGFHWAISWNSGIAASWEVFFMVSHLLDLCCT